MEVLIVLAIITLLSTAAVPAFNAITGTQGVTKGSYDVSTLLEYGRTEAISRQTYVWVVFQNAAESGQADLQMAAFASKDGTPTETSANIMGLTRILHVHNATLVNWSALKQTTKNLLSTTIPVSPTPTPADVCGNNSATPFLSGPATTQYSVTFTPRGEVMLKGAPSVSDSYDSWIDVSFQQTHGTQVAPNADEASLIIDGSTGAVQRLRL